MYRTTHRTRKAGVAVLAALLGISSGLIFAPPASAAAAVPGDLTLTALSQPTIGVGKANQPAGAERLTVTTGSTLTAGDQILITVDDSDGSACAAGDTLAFTALPTVAVTGTATIVATLESTLPTCGTDRLHLNVTGSGTATVNITGIAYTVGAAATVGPVVVAGTLNTVAFTTAAASNAYISSAILTANNPPTGAKEVSGGSYAISPLVIAEQNTTAADGGLCIYFSDNIEDTPAPAPTVAVTGGTDTAALTTDTAGDFIFVNVTPSGPASTSTFTISGVRLETDSNGLQTATVFADDDNNCANAGGTQLTSGNTTVGYVGQVNRFGGSDRFTTAQILFENEFGCSNDVIIARADLYPDALAASYLAGQAGTGILLTNTNSVPASTLNALRNEGVDNVYLMGGTTAISATVATQLDGTTAYNCGGGPVSPANTLTVQRIGGADRYETAQLVSEYPGLTQAGFADINNDGDNADSAETAIVTSGENFPDALAAGPFAFTGDNNCCGGPIPLLLTRTASVPSQTLGALGNLGIVNVVVVGGTVAVSDAAVAQLTAAGYNVRRIAGVNRQATAVALATALKKEFGFGSNHVSLARGDDFPDSLTGGPWSGSNGYAITLSASPTSLSSDTAAFYAAWKTLFGGTLHQFNVFGGTAAVSAGVVQAALNAASQQ